MMRIAPDAGAVNLNQTEFVCEPQDIGSSPWAVAKAVVYGVPEHDESTVRSVASQALSFTGCAKIVWENRQTSVEKRKYFI